MAYLVMCRTCDRKVTGSSPVVGDRTMSRCTSDGKEIKDLLGHYKCVREGLA